MFVFLIDNNPLITDWLKRQSEAQGWRFYALSSLREAAYFIHDLRPDVLVLDGQSVQGGEHFLSDSESYGFLAELPVIGLGEELPAWTKVLRVLGHLAKPLDPSLFQQQIAALLSSTERLN